MEEFTFRAAPAKFGVGEAFFNEALAFEETEHERGGKFSEATEGNQVFVSEWGLAR